MELKKYTSGTLFSMFLKQLLLLAFYILIEVFAFVFLFWSGLSIGFILPADYSQNYLERNKEIISKSEPFDASLIPHTCKYGLFDFNGNYLSGNLRSSNIEDAKVFIKNTKLAKHKYFLIENTSGYCVVNYELSSHFASRKLHKLLPHLERIILVLFVIIFILIVIKTAYSFGKKLKLELQPVLYDIEQIQNKEINLEHKSSQIKEFNDILLSLYDMKKALSLSLKKEWETEQKRKSNISALAHDIKTPLTIIKGNSELIKEENNISEIYQFADIIVDNCDKIERYISLLIDETKNDLAFDNQDKAEIYAIIEGIINESEALCRTKSIKLIISNTVAADNGIYASKSLIERAVINLVQNATEHTTNNKVIKLHFECTKDKKFIVKVEDFGLGFTKEALKYAKNQFYTEKTERSGEHYGIGMYFASTVAEKYNGSLSYYNKPNQTGAVVVFEISCQ